MIFNCLTLKDNGILDFGSNINYNIKQLSFQYTGDEDYSNWKDNKNEFTSIVDHIKESNIHFKLQKFSIFECNVKRNEVDLPGVEVVDKFWHSLKTSEMGNE